VKPDLSKRSTVHDPTLRADPRPSTPVAPSTLVPGLGHLPLIPFLQRQGSSREPGRDPPAGDRAPPRGVDVKPPRETGSPGPGSPLEGPGRAPGGLQTRLGTGLARGPRGPGPGRPGEGGFTSTPRAGALSPVRGGLAPSGAEKAQIPEIRGFGQKHPKKALLGPPRGNPGKTPF